MYTHIHTYPELSGGQVMLLTMGQTAYFGPAIDSLEHFALLGHHPVGLINPADYLLEVHTCCFLVRNPWMFVPASLSGH